MGEKRESILRGREVGIDCGREEGINSERERDVGIDCGREEGINCLRGVGIDCGREARINCVNDVGINCGRGLKSAVGGKWESTVGKRTRTKQRSYSGFSMQRGIYCFEQMASCIIAFYALRRSFYSLRASFC